MEDLEQQLIKANEAGSRFKIIVTDGVFYGWCCCTDKICDLADKYDAMVMIDECHATGFIGRQEKARLRLKE
jgi:glycine C-acetyltransferase